MGNEAGGVTLDEAIRLMSRMAQDLNDYLDAADQGGSDIDVTKCCGWSIRTPNETAYRRLANEGLKDGT